MAGTVPVAGDLTMENLTATLSRYEETAFEQVTALSVDTTTTQVRNLVTTVGRDPSGALSIVAAGATSQGTKILSATVYISGVKTAVDLYRLP